MAEHASEEQAAAEAAPARVDARPALPGATTSAERLLALQQTVGNRAVGALIARATAERKLVVARQPPTATRQSEEVDSFVHVGEGTTDRLRSELDRLQDRWQHRFELGLSSEVQTWMWDRIGRLRTLIAERGDSALPDASVELSFNGTTLTMSGTQSRSWPAVSGLPMADGSFDYSGSRQRTESVGPIPAGEYWIDPSQLVDLRTKTSTTVFDILSGLQWGVEFGHFSHAWGTHRITIHPFDSTADWGRGGFFIHGGTTPGSKGCIDLTSQMADFAQVLAALPRGQKVRLHVRYPPVGPLAPPGVAD